MHSLAAVRAKRFAAREAVGILEGQGRTEERRVEALVSVDVGVPPVDVLQRVVRLCDVRLGRRDADLGIVLERKVGGRRVAAHGPIHVAEGPADGEPRDHRPHHQDIRCPGQDDVHVDRRLAVVIGDVGPADGCLDLFQSHPCNVDFSGERQFNGSRGADARLHWPWGERLGCRRHRDRQHVVRTDAIGT